MGKASIPQALDRARKSLKRGDREQAIRLYQDILCLAPRHSQARAELATLTAQDNVSSLSIATTPEPKSIRELAALLQAKEYGVASQRAKEQIEAYPRSAALWNIYGASLQGSGELNAATCAFENAVHLAPDESGIQYNLARHYQKTGELDKSIKILQYLITLRPDWSEAHLSLGVALKEDGKIKEALPYYKRAAELDPSGPRIQNGLGVALHLDNNSDAAIRCFCEAIKFKSDYSEAYFNLGNALKRLDRINEAISAYQTAVTINPRISEAWFNLGNTLFTEDNYSECITCMNMVVNLQPNNMKARRAKGQALIASGKIDEAQSYFKDLVINFPKVPEFHYYLGRTYDSQGELVHAIRHFSTAYQFSPDSPGVFAALATKPQGCLPSYILEKMEKHYDKVRKQLSYGGQDFLKAHLLRHSGKFEDAWAYYSQANATVFERHRSSARRTLIDQNHAFSRLQRLGQTIAIQNQTDPISLFILAPSRSGKTRLESILGTSPSIKRGYENPTFMEIARKSAESFGEVHAGQSWKLNSNARKKFGELYGEELRNSCEDKIVFTDTSPHRIFNAWDIANLIPNSFFIFVERDPLDVAVAIFQTHYKWDGNFYAYHPDTIQDHLNWYRNMRETLLLQIGQQAIKVHYSDLTSDPETQLLRIEKLLGLSLSCHVPAGFTRDTSNTSHPYREYFKAIPQETSLDFLTEG
jgi:tetratricopeptide (TPR) repeat protein